MSSLSILQNEDFRSKLRRAENFTAGIYSRYSEDKILSIMKRLGKKIILQEAHLKKILTGLNVWST
jgi:hypothetical protein